MQRSGLAQIRERDVHRQRRARVRVVLPFIESAGVDPQPERLVGLRIKRDVQIGEIFPILGRAAPGKRPRHGMAVRASAAHVVVGDVGLILNPMLGVIHDRLRLFGRQAVIGGQIFQDRARFIRRQADAAQTHHALDGFFPAFRRGALPGDAQHVALFVFGVASPALGDYQLTGDRNALFGRRFSRLCGRGSLRLLGLSKQR